MSTPQPTPAEISAADDEYDNHVLMDDHPTGQRCGCGWAGTGTPGDTFDEHRFGRVLTAAANHRPDLTSGDLDLEAFDLRTRDALVAATLRFMTARGYEIAHPGDHRSINASTWRDRAEAAEKTLDDVRSEIDRRTAALPAGRTDVAHRAAEALSAVRDLLVGRGTQVHEHGARPADATRLPDIDLAAPSEAHDNAPGATP